MKDILIGILLPFIGTTLGSAMVFFMKNRLNNLTNKILLGFSAGIMMSASIWSLLIPSINIVKEKGIFEWSIFVVSFLLGIVFFIILDYISYLLNQKNNKMKKLKKKSRLFLAITIHNIPEGMAVGVIYAGVISHSTGITIAGALSLAIGIAIQNFPEGAIISMPMKAKGNSKIKAFIYGTLSGIVEPIGAILTILLTNFIVPILPYLLSYAAGAMIYVVVNELIPESQDGKYKNIASIALSIGFSIMMILDLTLC